ncbi:MAG: hypothetical protein ACYSWR_03830 [Planctomycetota bacterium]
MGRKISQLPPDGKRAFGHRIEHTLPPDGKRAFGHRIEHTIATAEANSIIYPMTIFDANSSQIQSI